MGRILSTAYAWPGEPEEAYLFQAAIDHHCACPDPKDNAVIHCPAHSLLVKEETVKRMLFIRRTVQHQPRPNWLQEFPEGSETRVEACSTVH